jgi:hypothetical protein
MELGRRSLNVLEVQIFGRLAAARIGYPFHALVDFIKLPLRSQL